MRVIITGSRDWTEPHIVRGILDRLNEAHPEDLIVVHGACPTGVDFYADRWCHWNGLHPVTFPADWRKLGPKAGPIRNTAMVNAGADLVIGFPMPGSVGTWDCMDAARAAGLTVINLGWPRRWQAPALFPTN